MLLRIGQCSAGLQTLHLGDDTGLEHALGRIIMGTHAFQSTAAQGCSTIGQLRREIALHQQGVELIGAAGCVGHGLIRHGIELAAHRIAQATHINRPNSRQTARCHIALALQIVVGRQAGKLGHRTAQLRRQIGNSGAQRPLGRVQVQIHIGRIAVGHAGDGH